MICVNSYFWLKIILEQFVPTYQPTLDHNGLVIMLPFYFSYHAIFELELVHTTLMRRNSEAS